MTPIRITLLSLFTFIVMACGKVETLQSNITNFSAGSSSDIKSVEVLTGVFYKQIADDSTSYSYLEYANTRFSMGTVPPSAQAVIDTFPEGTNVNVYFYGTFGKATGIAPDTSVEYDIVNLTTIKKK